MGPEWCSLKHLLGGAKPTVIELHHVAPVKTVGKTPVKTPVKPQKTRDSDLAGNELRNGLVTPVKTVLKTVGYHPVKLPCTP